MKLESKYIQIWLYTFYPVKGFIFYEIDTNDK